MDHSTVANLTIDEFKQLVREVAIQSLSEVFGDPDEGLELREDFEIELQRSIAATESDEAAATRAG